MSDITQPDNIIPFPAQPNVAAPTTSVYKVFQLNDVEWWMAPSLEEAITEAVRQTGLVREDVFDESCAHELTDEELDKLVFDWGSEFGKFNDPDYQHSFRKELKDRIEDGSRTEVFAVTDY